MASLPPLKRIAAINDISCLGKCSLTVALPIVSATGVECACIPTCILSTHTGGFEGYTYRDMSADILPIAEHWRREGAHFDAVFSGYLSSPAQAELVEAVTGLLGGKHLMRIVDPAMADSGRHYTGFDETMTKAFIGLCGGADVVTPNVTEAAFLTGLPYLEPPHPRAYISELVQRLGDLGPRIVTVTGVQYDAREIGAVAEDRDTGIRHFYSRPVREGMFHGGGDVFAAAYAAMLVRGAGTGAALKTAIDLVADSLERTVARQTPRHYGLDFEGALPAHICRVAEIFG